MDYIQVTVIISLSLYAILFLIGFIIKKQGIDSIDKGFTKILYKLFLIILYSTLIIPLTILSVVGVIAPFILLFLILSSIILSLLNVASNLIAYILLVIFSICLAYFASKTYNLIFFVVYKFNNTGFTENICNKFRYVLDKIDYRILTYSILLILYLLKNCLTFKYGTLDNVPNDLFFGLGIPVENIVLVSTEALLTFVIVDTIVTNSNRLKKKFLK